MLFGKILSGRRIFFFLLYFIVILIILILFATKYLNNRKEFVLTSTNEISSPTSSLFGLERRNIDRWKELERKFHYINMSLLSTPSPLPSKTIKFQCSYICGGLGDRVRGLIMAYLFALLSNRLLIVDMHRPCNFEDYFEGNIYKWISSSNFDSKGSSFSIRGIDSNEMLMNEIKTSPFIDTWSKYDHITIATNMEFIGAIFENPHLRSNPIISMFLQHMSPEEANIHTLFPLFYEILLRPTDRVVRFIDELLVNRSTEDLVCAHIRIGKNPSNPNDYAFPYADRITGQVINFISKYKFLEKSSSASLFVSSDSIDTTNEVTQYFLNRSFFIPGPILQLDLSPPDIDCKTGFMKVVADFYLLSECETILLTNSGFAAFANRRRKDPYKNLYKYNQEQHRFERCLDFRSPQDLEPARGVPIKLYCPIKTDNYTIMDIL